MSPQLRKRVVILSVSTFCIFLFAALASAALRLHTGAEPDPQASAPSESQQQWEVDPVEEKTLRLLICGIDNSQQLTDVLLYGVWDTTANTVKILQIPRDSFVGTSYPSGKINAVYGHPTGQRDGMEELKQVLQHQLGLPVDYTASITLEGFRQVIDRLGGVSMDVPFQIDYLPGKTLYPGQQVLSGEKAEWIVRYRAGYAMGDIGRVNMQKEFMKALFSTVKEKSLWTVLQIVVDNYSDIETDIPLRKMLSLAKAALDIPVEQIEMTVAPGIGAYYGSYAVYELQKEPLEKILKGSFWPKGKGTLQLQAVPPQA